MEESELEERLKSLEQSLNEIAKRLDSLDREKSLNPLVESLTRLKLDMRSFLNTRSSEEITETITKTYYELGIKLNEGVKITDLLETDFWKQRQLEKLNYEELKFEILHLMSLDSNFIDQRGSIAISNELWFLEREPNRVVKYGDFIVRLNLLSGNLFKFQDVENITENKYGTRFKYQGKEYEWVFSEKESWIDWYFFVELMVLINDEKPGNKDFYMIPKEDGEIFCYLTRNRAIQLRKILGLKEIHTVFERLSF